MSATHKPTNKNFLGRTNKPVVLITVILVLNFFIAYCPQAESQQYPEAVAVPPVDPTPPTTPVVYADQWTNSTTELSASWVSSDPESGIAQYIYCIGTRPGESNIVRWTSTGTQSSVTHTGLTLIEGRTYYFTVRAQNGQGLWSEPGSSSGTTVDVTAPNLTITSPYNGQIFGAE